VIGYRKYHPRTQQQEAKPEANDTENPSALFAASTADSSRTSNIAKNKDDDDVEALDFAFGQSLQWFPVLLWGRSRESFKTMYRLKKVLEDSLQDILRNDPALSDRIKAPSLFLKIGMDKKIVKERFKVLINIEKELGIVGKSSFVDTIHLLIGYIEVKNPFGEVNDEIEELTANGKNVSNIYLCAHGTR